MPPHARGTAFGTGTTPQARGGAAGISLADVPVHVPSPLNCFLLPLGRLRTGAVVLLHAEACASVWLQPVTCDIVLTHLTFDHGAGWTIPRRAVHLICASAMLHWPAHGLDRQRFMPQQRLSVSAGGPTALAPAEPCPGCCVRDLGAYRRNPDGAAAGAHARPCRRRGARPPRLGPDGRRRLLLSPRDDAENPWCTPGLRFYQRLREKDRRARLHNQRRLRALKQRSGAAIQLLSAHDPRNSSRSQGDPQGCRRRLERSLPWGARICAVHRSAKSISIRLIPCPMPPPPPRPARTASAPPITPSCWWST